MTVRVRQVRSVIGSTQRQRKTLRALGLQRINDVAEHKESEAVRGMMTKVAHLIEVEQNK